MFFILGTSPAAIVLIILNFFLFFEEAPFVSLATKANPSKAVLLYKGLIDGDRMSVSQTLFNESKIDIFSPSIFKETFFIILIAYLYLIILNI